MRKWLSTLIAVLSGLVVLAGYFLRAWLGPVMALLFEWALLLAGVAGLLGVANLLAFHIRKIIWRESFSIFSLITLLGFSFAFISGLILTPRDPFFQQIILNIQVPVEASLLAVLAATLAYASIRLIRVRGWTPVSIAFLTSALLFLILDLGFIRTGGDTLTGHVLAFLRRLPLAGARGVLLGMGLGGLVVGLRGLLTIDRPYGK